MSRSQGPSVLQARSWAIFPAKDKGQHPVDERFRGQLERRVRIVERQLDAPLEAAVGNLYAMDMGAAVAAREGAQRGYGDAAGIDADGDRIGRDARQRDLHAKLVRLLDHVDGRFPRWSEMRQGR